MIQRLNNDSGHDPTLNNDSGQDSRDNFTNETQIMNNISRLREDLPIWRKSPILRILPSCSSALNFTFPVMTKLSTLKFCDRFIFFAGHLLSNSKKLDSSIFLKRWVDGFYCISQVKKLFKFLRTTRFWRYMYMYLV